MVVRPGAAAPTASYRHEAREVAAHDLCLIVDAEVLQRIGVMPRCREPFRMRVVRAVQDMVNADQVDEVPDPVLVERTDVDAVLISSTGSPPGKLSGVFL